MVDFMIKIRSMNNDTSFFIHPYFCLALLDWLEPPAKMLTRSNNNEHFCLGPSIEVKTIPTLILM